MNESIYDGMPTWVGGSWTTDELSMTFPMDYWIDDNPLERKRRIKKILSKLNEEERVKEIIR